MSIIKVSDFSISSFSVGIPNKRHNNGYGSVILYEGKDIYIQTPVCKVENIGEDTICISFKLADNFEHFQFFCSLYELVLRHLFRYHSNEKYDILSESDGSQEDMRKRFYSYVYKYNDTDMIIKMKILKKSRYFDRNKNEVTLKTVTKDNLVVCIIKSNQLSMDSKSASHSWDCVQCLIWE